MIDLDVFNNNRYMWALSMLGVNIGGRAIVGDIGAMHPALFDGLPGKVAAVFCMFFMASRDVAVAAVMTLVFFVVVFGLFNPSYTFNILPTSYGPAHRQGGSLK